MRLVALLPLLIILSLSAVTGFCPVFSRSRPAAQHVLHSSSNQHEDAAASPFSQEITRRVALVMTAAAVTAGSSSVPAAQAASLAAIVSGLETEFGAEVNTKGAPEKHIPNVETSGTGSVKVVVPHVMDPEKPHYIEYIWLKDEATNKVVAAKRFKATDASPPTLTASIKKGSTVKPLLFCNLHGLWQGDSVSVA
jgi:desulfoferrodoxin-like iron-binding protein